MQNTYSADGKKPFFKQLSNILQEKKKKCLDDFDTE
jgi:hypothetical protein